MRARDERGDPRVERHRDPPGVLDFRTRVVDGLLGSFGFDANGDISESPMTIVQIRGRGSSNTVQSVEGAPVVRVVRPSPDLVAPEG